MQLHPFLIGLGLVLALAACRPLTAEYSESEAPKALTLDNASTGFAVRFAPGSSRLYHADAARLRRLAASGTIASSDRVTVAAAGSPALAAARVARIAAELLPYRIIATAAPLAAVPPNKAIIAAGRYLVTLPPCPNWSKEATVLYSNTLASNFGCANVVDLGLSVWSPADLAEGRTVGLADARTAVTAVNNYREGKVQLPAAPTLGPIAAPSAGAAPGAAPAAGP